eukprot:370546-Prorocentrum_minimum.AAC.1
MVATGTVLYTVLVLAVNIQSGLLINYWNKWNHLAVWGTIALWFIMNTVWQWTPVEWSNRVHRMYSDIVISGCAFKGFSREFVRLRGQITACTSAWSCRGENRSAGVTNPSASGGDVDSGSEWSGIAIVTCFREAKGWLNWLNPPKSSKTISSPLTPS